MPTNTYVANRFREVFLNGKWVANTNFKEQLSQVTLCEANYKIGNLNTIGMLTFHINYYVAGILNVFDNGKLEIRDMYSFDAPPLESESDWKNLVATFIANAERFADHIERMSEEEFHKAFVDEKYGNYLRNIDGMIEHTYYHLGQVSLIRKMIAENIKT